MIKSLFQQFMHDFYERGYATDMEMTIENSPYHREDNVWVHTQMVVEEYSKLTPSTWNHKHLMGALVCLFHDMGKPRTEEETTKDDGSVRRSYKGHEATSGAYWMDFWCDNIMDIQSLIPDVNDAYNIMVMIAYHLPYQLRDQKLGNLVFHLQAHELVDVFCDVLMSDKNGRISDQEVLARDNSALFIESIRTPVYSLQLIPNAWMMVGVPGSGKSSYFKDSTGITTYSFDSIRLAAFPDAQTYDEAYRAFNEYDFQADKRLHTQFGISPKVDTQVGFMNNVLMNTVKNLGSDTLVIDNTSISRKARRKLMNVINQTDSGICFGAAFMFTSLGTALHNNMQRGHFKYIPGNVIINMYYNQIPPILGEFAAVDVNLVRKY